MASDMTWNVVEINEFILECINKKLKKRLKMTKNNDSRLTMTCQCRDSHKFLTVNCHCHGKIFSFVTILSLSRARRFLIVNVCHCHDFDKTMCKFLTMSLSCRPLAYTFDLLSINLDRIDPFDNESSDSDE